MGLNFMKKKKEEKERRVCEISYGLKSSSLDITNILCKEMNEAIKKNKNKACNAPLNISSVDN